LAARDRAVASAIRTELTAGDLALMYIARGCMELELKMNIPKSVGLIVPEVSSISVASGACQKRSRSAVVEYLFILRSLWSKALLFFICKER
jgi:hypothetical protein